MKDNKDILVHNLDELKQAIMDYPELALKQGAGQIIDVECPKCKHKGIIINKDGKGVCQHCGVVIDIKFNNII